MCTVTVYRNVKSDVEIKTNNLLSKLEFLQYLRFFFVIYNASTLELLNTISQCTNYKRLSSITLDNNKNYIFVRLTLIYYENLIGTRKSNTLLLYFIYKYVVMAQKRSSE